MQPDDLENDVDDLPRKPLEIASDTASSAAISWGFSLFIAALTGYGAYSMTRGEVNWSRDWPILGAFVMLFPAIAAFLVLSSIWATMLLKKQGRTVLHIPSGFVVEGESLRGFIVCSRALKLRGPARLCLECLERRTVPDREDGGTRTETRKVVSLEQTIEPESQGAVARNTRAPGCGTRFALDIAVPKLSRVPNPLPTARGTVSKSARVQWNVSLEAPTSGLDFQAHFDLIVLAPEQSD